MIHTITKIWHLRKGSSTIFFSGTILGTIIVSPTHVTLIKLAVAIFVSKTFVHYNHSQAHSEKYLWQDGGKD